jgi:PAS domain S-box-containing protein
MAWHQIIYLSPLILASAMAIGLALYLWRTRWREAAGGEEVLTHRHVVASMHDGVIVLDDENRILEMNPAAEKLIGGVSSDVIGRPVEQVWADWPDKMESLCHNVETRREISLGRADDRRHYDVLCSAVTDAHGRVISRVVLVRDISERKRSEDTLHQARRELERRDRQLAQILATENSMRLGLELDAVLQEMVERAPRSLGCGAVVLYLIDQDSEQVRVSASAGLDDAGRRFLEDATCSWDTFQHLMQAEFQAGSCYFIPAGASDWEKLQGPVINAVSHGGSMDDADDIGWCPGDVLLVPVELRPGKLAGVLLVDQPPGRKRPGEETLQMLDIYANLVAVALENAHLYAQVQRELSERAQAEERLRELTRELERRVADRTAELARINADLMRQIEERKQTEAQLLQRNRELLSLQSAATATTSSLDLEFVLQTVTWEMATLLGVDGCVIFEWNAEANTLHALAEYSVGALGGEETIKVQDLADRPLRKTVLNERYAQQINTDQPYPDRAERRAMGQANIQSLLMLPMVFQDRVVGLVELRECGAARSFTDHEISLAQLLSNQAASAVENARLYERAQAEIAERMRVEKQITASLKEKEMLLKEIHHRVKNNLQIISSLLKLQSKGIQDAAALELFKESQSRVRSMALIHEKLYRSGDLANVDFAEYVQNLAASLVRSYRADSVPTVLRTDIQGVRLGIDAAVPCGLVINELITNALKYAFPPGWHSPIQTSATGESNGQMAEIRVELRRSADHQLTLIVADNGVGFPAGLDFRDTESLGMRLVNTLVDQLDGTLELSRNAGTEFKIMFPVPPGVEPDASQDQGSGC